MRLYSFKFKSQYGIGNTKFFSRLDSVYATHPEIEHTLECMGDGLYLNVSRLNVNCVIAEKYFTVYLPVANNHAIAIPIYMDDIDYYETDLYNPINPAARGTRNVKNERSYRNSTTLSYVSPRDW